MSDRRMTIPSEEAAQLLRDILDRLERLERGGAIAGRISLHEEVVLGGIVITVTETSETGRTLTFVNPLTGIAHVLVM